MLKKGKFYKNSKIKSNGVYIIFAQVIWRGFAGHFLNGRVYNTVFLPSYQSGKMKW